MDGKEYPSGFTVRELQHTAWAISFGPDGQRVVLVIGMGVSARPDSRQLLLVTAPGGRIEPLWFKQEGGRGFPSALPDWFDARFPVWNPKSGKLMGIVRSSQTTDNFWTEGYLGKTYQEIYSESLRLDGPDAVTFMAGNEGKLLFVRQPLK